MILSYFQEMRWILYFLVKLHNVLCNFVILFLGFYYKFDRVFSDIYFNFMTTPDKREYRKLIFASHLNCLQGCHIIAFAFKLSINCNCNVYSLQISETNTNKLISMMRGKSPPSEHILYIIHRNFKSNNSLVFKEDLERETIYDCLLKYHYFVFLYVYP